eukprot:16388509-Heterocapsa_arctica.AAC.1
MAFVLLQALPPSRLSTTSPTVVSYCRGSGHAWSECQAPKTCQRIPRPDGKRVSISDTVLTATSI